MRKDTTHASKYLNGKIIVSSPSGRDGDYVQITIEDQASGLIIAELEMDYENFGKMLARPTTVPCQIEYYPNPNIGKELQVKREIVPGLGYNVSHDEWLDTYQAAVASYEIDGWKADIDKKRNPHRVADNGYQVTFRRYVEE